MTTQQPEALRLADSYEATYLPGHLEVAAELRRQHARIVELEAQLAAAQQAVQDATAHPAEAVPDERAAFEQWLGVKPCGAAHDFGWSAWRARAALAATQTAAQGMEKDVARWRMVVLISSETMTHPDKRTAADAVAAYMHAVHSGLDIQGAVDAAIAAQAKQGEQP